MTIKYAVTRFCAVDHAESVDTLTLAATPARAKTLASAHELRADVITARCRLVEIEIVGRKGTIVRTVETFAKGYALYVAAFGATPEQRAGVV